MKQFLRSFLTLLLLMMWCSVGFAQETLKGSWDLTKEIADWTANGNEAYFSQPYGYKKAKGTLVNKSIADFSTAGITQIKVGFKCLQNGGNTSKITIYLVNAKGEALGTGIEVTPTNAKVASQTVYRYATFTSNLEEATGFMMKVTNFGKNILVNGASYEVTYNASTKTKTTLTFPETAISINGGDEASFKGQSAKLYAGEQELTDKTIEYAYTYTGDDIFATFDGTTGAATLKSGVYGTATVTATYAGDDTYAKAVASYTVTVKNPNVFETAYDFVNNSYGYTRKDYLKEGDIISNKTPVIIINTKNGGTDTRFWDKDFRNYQNAVLTIKSDEGFIITKITMTGTNINQLNLNDGNGSWTKEDGVWSGSSQSISFTNPGSKQDNKVIIKTIEIEYASTITTLGESKDNTETISNNNGKTIDIKLTRTLVANKWNTFCVPFETELAGTALEGATVKAVGTIEGNVINLEDATKIEAGVPYLVMPTTESIVNPTFKSVTISVTTPKEAGNDEYKFVGTYSPKTINKGEFGKIWGVTAEGKLAKINANTTMKGLRAYFVFPVNVAAKLNFDGETTGINNIETNATVNGKVYNLNGQYVGNSLNGLKKGIYVVNGKKVIK